MLASELITRLQIIIAREGDKPVFLNELELKAIESFRNRIYLDAYPWVYKTSLDAFPLVSEEQ